MASDPLTEPVEPPAPEPEPPAPATGLSAEDIRAIIRKELDGKNPTPTADDEPVTLKGIEAMMRQVTEDAMVKLREAAPPKPKPAPKPTPDPEPVPIPPKSKAWRSKLWGDG